MICQNCQRIFKVWQNFFSSFDLGYNRSENIKISNCLEIYGFAKNTRIFCEFCRKYEWIITKKIYHSPNDFIFLLNLKGNENINFVIEQEINLYEFIENKYSPLIYELNGIIFFDVSRNK